jgi:DNA-binding Lrp family transcriptional regulator
LAAGVKLGEVLQRVPGLEKRFVYYLEAQGDIQPTRLPKARIARRDYSADDLRRIARLWEFYRRGYSLASARELLSREANRLVYALLRVETRRWSEAVALLEAAERVRAAAAVYGESADVVAEVEASRDEDVAQVLHGLFDRGLLLGPPLLLHARLDPARVRCAERNGRASMLAYVLMKVPAKHLDGVLERLRGFEGVTEASVIYGETDLIARLEVPDQAALDDLIIRKIQDLPEVEATRTFIGVGGMHWERER